MTTVYSHFQKSKKSLNSPSYILLHGAWHGSWCWYKLVNHTKNLGYNIIAPDLPGLYAKTDNFKEVTLKTYVDHIQQLLSKLPGSVILVGHSMAGAIISQVAENIPHKIDQLIYISGFIPENGTSLLDEEKQASQRCVASEVIVDKVAASIALPLHTPHRLYELFYGKCTQEDFMYALERLQKQPLRPFMDTVSLSTSRFGEVPKLYIECLQDKVIPIEDQRRMHRRIDCEVASLDTDHSPFFSAAAQLGNLIFGKNSS